jgi:hypothetical protein
LTGLLARSRRVTAVRRHVQFPAVCDGVIHFGGCDGIFDVHRYRTVKIVSILFKVNSYLPDAAMAGRNRTVS